MRSIAIPFRFANGGIVETSDNETIARQRIRDVLVTRPFERVNRPDYGAAISDLLFEPIDPLIIADYKVDAINTLNDHVSNALVRDLIVQEGDNYGLNEESTMSVSVVYQASNNSISTFSLSISNDEILTEESDF